MSTPISTPLIFFQIFKHNKVWEGSVSHMWWWHQEQKISERIKNHYMKRDASIMYEEFTIKCSHFHQLVKVFTNSNILGQEFNNVTPIRSPSHPRLGFSLKREKRSNVRIFNRNKRHLNLHFQSLPAFRKWSAYSMVSWFHQQFSDIFKNSLHINSPSDWNRRIVWPWVAWIPPASN